MTTYNTGNPVGSTDVRDLYDNAQNLDLLVAGPLDQYPDRLGAQRKSWRGIENDFYDFLAASGFESTVLAYTDGVPLQVDRPTQLIERASAPGIFYSVQTSETFPIILTGTWATDEPKLVVRVDQPLRGELLAPTGAEIVGWQPSAYSDIADNVSQAIANLQRTGVTGLFTTGSHLSGGRFGTLAYRKQVGGNAKLLTSLSRLYPAGAFIHPVVKQQSSVQIVPGAFSPVGDGTIFRSINASNDFWGVAGNERMRATVIDTVTGRKYLDRRSYPTTEYSCDVIHSAGFGGLVVEVKHPSGVGAPTNLAVQLFYRDDTQGRAIYVDPIGGDDLLDGSSFEWPMKTIPAAIAKSPAVIFLKPGVYSNANYPGDYVAAGDIAIKCVGGRASFVSRGTTATSWALHSGTVYVSTIGGSSTPVGVVDLSRFDEFGTPDILTPVGSIAACQATPKSFYYDGAGPRLMYVNTRDGGAPSDASVLHYNSLSTFRHSSATAKVYLEGIDFIGGTGGAISARNADASAVLITDRCRFIGNYNSNGADIKDIGLSISIDCVAAYNANDGFNYTQFNSLSPHFIEIGCCSYRNFGGGTGNGTTSHDNCVGFRIGCDTTENTGPGIADVGSAKTYNVNCSSTRNGPSPNASGFRADGTASVVIDGGSAFNNGGDDLQSTGGAPILARDVYANTRSGAISVLP